ncbi:MAG: hypothetical protein R2734_08770 [Nocardioides sp.]
MALLHCDFFSDALGMGTDDGGAAVELDELAADGWSPPGDLPTPGALPAARPVRRPPRGCDRRGRPATPSRPGRATAPAGRSFYRGRGSGPMLMDLRGRGAAEVRAFGSGQQLVTTYVAGLSMGGRRPGSRCDTRSGTPRRPACRGRWNWLLLADGATTSDRVFGGALSAQDDLFALLDRADLPPLWVGCGTENQLVAGNHAFVARARERGHQVTADFRRRAAGACGTRCSPPSSTGCLAGLRPTAPTHADRRIGPA